VTGEARCLAHLRPEALARVAFGLLVIVLPWRYRWTLVARPSPPIHGEYTGFFLYLSDVALLLTLGLWALSLLARPRQVSPGPSFLRWPAALLLLAAAVSVPASVDPALSLYHLIRLSLLAALAVYALNEIRPGHFLIPLAASLALQALIGLAQALAQRSVGLHALGEHGLDPGIRGVGVLLGEGGRFLRAYGLSDHPNLLAGCLAFGLATMLGWSGAIVARWRLAWMGAFALGALGLYLTFSRTAWLALGVGAGVSLALNGLRRERNLLLNQAGLLAASALVVAPFVAWTAPYLTGRLDTQSTPTQQAPLLEREYLNRVTARVFLQRPWTGAGLGALTLTLRAADPVSPLPYQPAHVVALVVAAETGLAGLPAFTILTLSPWAALWARRRSLTPELTGAAGLWAALAVAGLLDYYLWQWMPGRLWWWLGLALWAAAWRRAQDEGMQDVVRA
jgi:hypothetical protein